MVVPQPIDRMGLFRGSAPIRPISVHHLAGFQPCLERGTRAPIAAQYRHLLPLPSWSVLLCWISTRSLSVGRRLVAGDLVVIGDGGVAATDRAGLTEGRASAVI